MGIGIVVGLLIVVGGVALVVAVLGFLLSRARASGRSASRGRGTGEGGAAFHAGTRPGPDYGSDAGPGHDTRPRF